ncbi:host cell division inhibitor Icd-like protein [Enterobacter roggenkampii]|nr:host cell division inhibitor Icd-like protein [Enterobacter roggenkampii]MCK6915888.1 host cell division inhibitor Icd-like protein [Enterobacter roggenkampii]HCM9201337.1 ash family protein [Enterobacter roggenkampii]HCM9205298.1 ash family protein [Enterobacter roggenkampii]
MPGFIYMFNTQDSVIKFLHHAKCSGYIRSVAAKSAIGRRNPCYLKATPHAPSVFFCVVALTHPYFMVWWLTVSIRYLRHIIQIMVVQAGQLSGWPVSFRAGIPTPVWATTHERRNSGGSVTRYLKEIATMATIPALPHPQFTFVFLAVRRSDCAARPFAVRTVATCERAARLKLVADFVLSFAARIPMNNFGEVNA